MVDMLSARDVVVVTDVQLLKFGGSETCARALGRRRARRTNFSLQHSNLTRRALPSICAHVPRVQVLERRGVFRVRLVHLVQHHVRDLQTKTNETRSFCERF